MKTLLLNRMFIAVSVIACLNFFSFSAKAFSGTGSGTSVDPYLITSASQLNEVRNSLSSCYQLTADIDLTDWITTNSPTYGWLPIGSAGGAGSYFAGTFDGNGHVITGLWITRTTPNPQYYRVGLFGTVGGTVTIKNLGVTVASGKSVSGDSYVGGIVGAVVDGATLTMSSCYVQGNISTTSINASTSFYAGGLIGGIYHPSTAIATSISVTNCYAGGGTVTSYGNGAGGLVGAVTGLITITIDKCYAANTIVNTDALNSASGILPTAGQYGGSAVTGINVTISNCVAINPSITGKSTLSDRIFSWASTGATITLSNNYALDAITVNGSTITSGTATNYNGLNKTASELITQATYEALGWDFTSVWQMGSGTYTYPVLKNVKLTTGIKSVSDLKSRVYYNSQSENILVTEKAAGDFVNVYDTQGRLMVRSQESVINISRLSKGTYLVNIAGYSTKIQKQF